MYRVKKLLHIFLVCAFSISFLEIPIETMLAQDEVSVINENSSEENEITKENETDTGVVSENNIEENITEVTPFSSEGADSSDVVTFDGTDLIPNNATVSYPLNTIQGVVHSVYTQFVYDASATNKTITIELSEEMGLENAPGMTKVSNGNWTFNSADLPEQYKNVITNATFTSNGTIYGYQLKSGTLVYELSDTTTAMNLTIGTKFDFAFAPMTNSKTINEAVKIDFEQTNSGIADKRKYVLDEYIITGNAGIRLTSFGAASKSVIEGTAFNFENVRLMMGTNDYTLVGYLIESLDVYIRIPKELGFLSVTPTTGSDITQSQISWTIDSTSSATHDIIQLKLSNIYTTTSSAIDFNFSGSGVVADAVYNFQATTANGGMTVPYDSTYIQNAMTGASNNFQVNGQSASAAANILDVYGFNYQLPIESENTDDRLLGIFRIKNNQAIPVENQLIRYRFNDPNIGVQSVRIGGKKAGVVNNIKVVTNKGNTYTLATKSLDKESTVNNMGFTYVKLTDFGVTDSTEFITEMIYEIPSLDSGQGTVNTPTGYHDFTNGYFGVVLNTPSNLQFTAQISSVPASDGNFNGANALHATGTTTMSTTATDNTVRYLSYSQDRNVIAGDTVSLYTTMSFGMYSKTVISRGVEVYLREGDYLNIDINSIYIENPTEGTVFRVSDGTLTPVVSLDNQGKKVIKIVAPTTLLGRTADLAYAPQIRFNAQVAPSAPTTSIPMNELVFYQITNHAKLPVLYSAADVISTRQNVYNVDGTSDLTRYFGTGPSSNKVVIQAQQAFIVTTSANLNNGPWTGYDYTTNNTILNLNPSGTVGYQLNAVNNTGNPVDGYTALIPIPKANENTGLMPSNPNNFNPVSDLQKTEFEWTASLLSEVDVTGKNLNYTVTYSTNYATTIDDASFVPWNSIADKNDIRMVKITTSDTMISGFQEAIDFPLSLTDPNMDLNAGKTNIYSARIYRNLDGITSYVASQPVAIRLQTGVVKGQVFADDNRNGIKDSGEIGVANVDVLAYEAGTSILIESTKTLADGTYQFLGLNKSVNVDIVFVNPSSDDSYRFSSPASSSDFSRATVTNIVPSSTASVDVDAGLMTPYIITFDGNTGISSVAQLKKYPGETIDTAPTASKPGYTLSGWSKAQNGAVEAFPYSVTQSETLYAQWTPSAQYTLTYDGNGNDTGVEPAAVTAYIDTNIVIGNQNTLAKSNHVFDGWNTAADGSGTAYAVADLHKITADITLYAQWLEDPQYTITFLGNTNTGGTAPSSFTEYVNESVILPTEGDLVKSGYTFTGWNTAADGSGVAYSAGSTYNITSNQTFYAQWIADLQTVIWDYNGGVDSLNNTSLVDSTTWHTDETITLSDVVESPTRTGYTFTGWSTLPHIVTTGTNTITASWSADVQTVIWDYNGGVDSLDNTSLIDSTTWHTDEIITASDVVESPTRTGYTFTGWSTLPHTVTAGTNTITANWNANAQTVIWDYNGGVDSLNNTSLTDTTTWHTDEVITITDVPMVPTRDGYTFTGWSTLPHTVTTGTNTITAEWTADLQTVIWDYNGGVDSANNTSLVDGATWHTDEVITITDVPTVPTRDGYTFTGWSTLPHTVTTGTNTITANWSADLQVVIWDYNGGVDSANNTSLVDGATWHTDEVITITDVPTPPTRDGYTFTGWSTLPHTVTAGTNTITANWSANAQTVTWDYNGGIDSLNNTMLVDVTTWKTDDIITTTDTPTTPTRDGYTFVGWSTLPYTVINGINTITAEWSADVQTVTWDYNGGVDSLDNTSLVDSTTWHTDEIITLSDAPTTPTRDGYTFTGWNTLPYTVTTGINTITAEWSADVQTVIWDYNGGVDSLDNTSLVDSTTWHTDEIITSSDTPTTPSKTGYTFIGWSTLPHTVTTGTNTITANWSANQQTLTWHFNDGVTANQVDNVLTDQSVSWLTPTRTGYDFAGWYADASYTIALNNPFIITANTIGTNTDVYAKWTANAQTLTWHFNDGITADQVDNVITNQNILWLTPTRTGYIFGGWYYDDSTFSTIVSNPLIIAENITGTNTDVYAKWIPNIQTLTWHFNDGVTTNQVDNVVTNQNIDWLTPNRDGYTFAGWYSDINLTTLLANPFAIGENAAGTNTDAYAKWTANAQTLTWHFNDGVTADQVDNVITNQSVPWLTPTRTGYTLVGWYYDDSTFVSEATKPIIIGNNTIGTNTDVYAKWSTNPTVQWNFNDGVTLPVLDNTKAATDTITASDEPTVPTRTGYTFLYWELLGTSGNIDTQYPITVTATGQVINAIWTANTQTLTWHFNDGVTTNQVDNVVSDQSIIWLNPTRDGYTFGGWYYDDDIFIATVGNPFIITPNITGANTDVYAKWIPNAQTLTWHFNDGVTANQVDNVTTGQSVNLLVPSRNGYAFGGWYKDSSLTIPLSDPFTIENNLSGTNTDVYAKWIANAQTLTWHFNDGVTANQIDVVITNQSISLLTPTRLGYTFNGWYTDVSLTTAATDPYIIIEAIAGTNTDLYAKWTANAQTLTWHFNDGVTANQIDNVSTDQSVSWISTPMRSGYTFGGWYTDATLTTTFTNPSIIMANEPGTNTDVYAKWIADIQTVTWDYNGGVDNLNNPSLIDTTTWHTDEVITIPDAPTSPTRDGYTFTGWSTLPYTVTTGTNTITANWSADLQVVTWDYNGGVDSANNTSLVDGATWHTDEVITTTDVPTPPTRDGYTFTGWSTLPHTVTTGTNTITANWSADTQTVIWDYNGGIDSLDNPSLIDTTTWHTDEIITTTDIPVTVTRDGYTFTGWSTLPHTVTTGTNTITANWSADAQTVIWDYNGGIDSLDNPSLVDTTTWHTDEVITTTDVPTIPIRDGYTFTGWSTLPHTVTTGINTITANWNADAQTVIWDYNGGVDSLNNTSLTDTTTWHTDEIITTTDIPVTVTRDGYTFTGWSTLPHTVTTGTNTITAEWTADLQTVIWDYNGGVDTLNNTSLTDTTTWHTDEVITISDVPTSPTRDGYTFTGWSTLPYTVTTGINTITANWSADLQIVTWDYNGGVDSANNTSLVDGATWHTDEVITITDVPTSPTRDGYTFTGWSTLPHTVTTGTNTITAEWTADLQTVIWDYNGGVDSANNTSLVDGATWYTDEVITITDVPTSPTRDGYTFTGWSTLPHIVTTGTNTITANWSADLQVVTWDYNGGVDSANNTSLVDGATWHTDEVITITDVPTSPTRDGYTFIGWSTLPHTVTTGTNTITANWSIDNQTVTWDYNGGVDSLNNTSLVDITTWHINDIITTADIPTTPIRDGYTFTGWSTLPHTVTTGTNTITANWSANQQTLTWHFNDGVTNNQIDNVVTDQSIDLLEPTRDGYTFAGWYYDDSTYLLDVSNPLVISGNAVGTNTDVYAKWIAVTYTVEYIADDADGGIIPVDLNVYYYSDQIVVLPDTPTKTGYTFTGWKHLDKIYHSGDSILISTLSFSETANSNNFAETAAQTIKIVFVAQWEKDESDIAEPPVEITDENETSDNLPTTGESQWMIIIGFMTLLLSVLLLATTMRKNKKVRK